MSQVQAESRKQRRRRSKIRHRRLHPRTPAQPRQLKDTQRTKPQPTPATANKVPAALRPKPPAVAPAPAATTAAQVTGNEEDVFAPDLEASRAMGTPIEELNLTVRSYNVLQREGMRTIEQLCDLTVAYLLSFQNLGERSINQDIRPKLAALTPPRYLRDEGPNNT